MRRGAVPRESGPVLRVSRAVPRPWLMVLTVAACAFVLATATDQVDWTGALLMFVVLSGGIAHLLDVATHASFDVAKRSFRYSPVRRPVALDLLGDLTVEFRDTETDSGSIHSTFFLMCRAGSRSYELFADSELATVIAVGQTIAAHTGVRVIDVPRERPPPSPRSILAVAMLTLLLMALAAFAAYRGSL